MYFKFFSLTVIICSAYGILSGNADACAAAVIDGAHSAITLLIGIGGLLCFWNGISRVINASRLSSFIAVIFAPLTKMILGKDFERKDVRKEASLLLCANVLGLSNASTPIALSLMKKLDSKTDQPNASSVSVALCSCAPPSVIPMTVLSILYASGFEEPLGLLPYVWICSFLSFLFALITGMLYRRLGGRDE